MLIELGIAGTLLIANWVYREYHRLEKRPPTRDQEIQVPRIEPGLPVPMIFGRCRVRAPVLAWTDGAPHKDTATIEPVTGPNTEVYRGLWMRTFYVLGIPFAPGDDIANPVAENRVHRLYAGDLEAPIDLSSLTGNGAFETPKIVTIDEEDASILGKLEFLNGGEAQLLVNGAAAVTYSGSMMLAAGTDADDIPGYRGVMSVGLFGAGGVGVGFDHGKVTSIPAYSFEASSYATNDPDLGTYAKVGFESNPINVLYALHTNPPGLGGLGVPKTDIDLPSWQAAQYTLRNEGHGYSRALDTAVDAAEAIRDIAAQIDAVLYEEPTTGKTVVKLIRNDYDPNTIPTITRKNCKALTGFALGGRENLINKVTVVYPNRDKDYNDDHETAQNVGSIRAGGGIVREEVVHMPGICTQALAKIVAARILTTFSRPLIKCRASGCSRELMRVRPGDVLKLTWTNPDMAGVVMRVVDVSDGTMEDGGINLDLVQDAYYVYRNQSPQHGGFDTGLDNPPVVVLGG